MAAGQTNAAVDANGDLFTWQPHLPSSMQHVAHGSLDDICIGGGLSGLCRDKESKLYEWRLGSIQRIKKKAALICQGGNSTIIVKRKPRTQTEAVVSSRALCSNRSCSSATPRRSRLASAEHRRSDSELDPRSRKSRSRSTS